MNTRRLTTSRPFISWRLPTGARYGSGLLWFLVLLACPAALRAQQPGNYIVRQYTIENGLPQNTIGSLSLDRNGFLWMATQGGLCRFDGRRFNNYTSDNSILPTERIGGLTIDDTGRIHVWANRDVTEFFYVDEHYHLQREHQFEKRNFILLPRQKPFFCDSFLHCVNASGAHHTFALRHNEAYHVAGFFPVNRQQVYLYVGDTLYWIDAQRRQFASHNVRLHPGPVVGNCLLSFDERWQPMVWQGPERIVPQTTPGFRQLLRRLQQKPAAAVMSFGNSGGTIGLMCVDKEVWGIGCHQGIWDAFLLYDNLMLEQKISSLCYDEQNKLLFIGTLTDGFYMVRKNPFETIFFEDKNPLSNYVYALLQIDEHTVTDWYYRFDPISKTGHKLTTPLSQTAFLKSADGRFWYKHKDTLYIAGAGLVVQQKISMGITPSAIIRAFMEDEDHKVWFCTDNSLGYVADNRLHYVFKESAYFSVCNLSTLFSFDKEHIWIGTGNGILVYHKRTNKIESRFLRNNLMRSVYRDRNGNIWVSTYGKGIYTYRAGKFIALPLDTRKDLRFAHGFIEDDNGFFWIPTNNGLFQCKKEELNAYVRKPGKGVLYYYQHNKAGAYTDEFNGGIGQPYIRFNNLVLLPSARGVLSFDPLKVQPLLPNREILIEDIVANGKTIEKENDFLLPPGNQRLKIDVAAPYFGDGQNNVLEYQLPEITQQWFPLTEGTIVYNSLPKGSYHLTIRKRTGFGVGNYAYKKISFTVQPFWYETFWFWTAVIVSLSGIVYLLIRRRIRSLEKTKYLLEQKVAERTSELEVTVEELNLSEQELSRVNMVQEQALAVILHDIRSPLNYLSVSARYFNRNIAQLSHEEIVEYSNSLVLSTSTIDKFSNDLVQWLSFNHDNEKLRNEAIDLPKLLREIKSLYNEIAALNNNTIVVKAEGTDRVVADWNKLYLVVRNLVDNATKHCHNGTITLSGKRTAGGDHVAIEVTDTGSGIAAEELRQWQTDTDSLPDFQKDKLGLSMVNYFVKLMKGQLDIASEPGKGTHITITLPG